MEKTHGDISSNFDNSPGIRIVDQSTRLLLLLGFLLEIQVIAGPRKYAHLVDLVGLAGVVVVVVLRGGQAREISEITSHVPRTERRCQRHRCKFGIGRRRIRGLRMPIWPIGWRELWAKTTVTSTSRLFSLRTGSISSVA